ncbi:MAG: response regulator, partial [Gammaproteobacteria bacterium]
MKRRAPLVLVVDDDPIVRILSEQSLRAADFEVVSLADAERVLERMDEIRPDVLLLDIQLPGGDGFTLCEQLRHHETGKNVPIVVMTA